MLVGFFLYTLGSGSGSVINNLLIQDPDPGPFPDNKSYGSAIRITAGTVSAWTDRDPDS